jgi:2'-5' RNA ligase
MDRSFSEERIDLFALVAYIPQPLAGFLDALRHELAPGCRLRAHITLLPPRELACDPQIASLGIEKALRKTRSFRVSVGEVRVFPGSEVIHAAVDDGVEQLRELHAQLNQGGCKAPELWRYQPHVTLVQDLEPAAVPAAFNLAVRRWREYSGPRSFALDHLTFVRRSLGHDDCAVENRWVDLATWELPSPVLA